MGHDGGLGGLGGGQLQQHLKATTTPGFGSPVLRARTPGRTAVLFVGSRCGVRLGRRSGECQAVVVRPGRWVGGAMPEGLGYASAMPMPPQCRARVERGYAVGPGCAVNARVRCPIIFAGPDRAGPVRGGLISGLRGHRKSP